MSKKSLNAARGKELFGTWVNAPEKAPVSFTYNGVSHTGLGSLELTKKDVRADGAELRFRLDDTLEVTLEIGFCAEFGEIEYLLRFRNCGGETSKVLEDVRAVDAVVPGNNPKVRGCLGDHDNRYAPYEHDLSKGATGFQSENGLATHIVFPYFDFVHGDGGTLMAAGWAGTWSAMFAPVDGATAVRIWTCNGFRSVLRPGETVRTGLVVLLPYTGRNADDAANLWREWYLKYNMPSADASGAAVKPFSTCCFADDTGLPNSDGSISERHFTWKPTLDKLVQEGIASDFRWIDTGWYSDPAGNTVESDWWGTAGSWELDKVKWPGTTFRDACDACRKAGIKVLLWFAPERITHTDDLVRNYGYKPEWAIPGSMNWRGVRHIVSNIGNEECLRWTLDRITRMLETNGVDLYREDNNNSCPSVAWDWLDAEEEKRHGLPRRGITENKFIQGHYRLWDGILEFCRTHGKCTFLDSCAAGGGRNDIESMRRGVPFMRSDYDRTTTALRLSMTSTFCRWIPFHGAATKETAGELESVRGGRGTDTYVNRASLLPVYNISGMAFTHDPDLDFAQLRKNFQEWKSVRHLLLRDLYVLTPWHHGQDRMGWTAIAYDAPDTGESLLLAFRQEECVRDTQTLRLPFAETGTRYEVADEDTGTRKIYSGETLRETGLNVKLDRPRSSAMFRIRRKD